MAHYHMGGVRVTPSLETAVPGLYACGEAVGGANGANRLSGNAMTEAFVFGAQAGINAAARAATTTLEWSDEAAAPTVDLLRSARAGDGPNLAQGVVDLQALMSDKVGPFRTAAKLAEALADIERMTRELGAVPRSGSNGYDTVLLDWLDLRNMLLVARSVTMPALARTESRGAHQREDHIALDDAWTVNQILGLRGDAMHLDRVAPPSLKGAA